MNIGNHNSAFQNQETGELHAQNILENRLKDFLPIDTNTEIDASYVTCAEYQLFIDEELKFRRFRQPDHWKTAEIPAGSESQPIKGVRVQDADAFCRWLSRKEPLIQRLPAEVKYQYRLPKEQEIINYPISINSIGCWGMSGNKSRIIGLEKSYLETWQSQLADIIVREIGADLTRDYDLPLHLGDRDQARDSALERVRNRNKSTPHVLRLYERSPDLERLYDFDLDDLRQSSNKLEKSLRREHKFSPELSMYIKLVHDLDDALRRADTIELIRSYLLCIHIIWDLALTILRDKDLSTQKHERTKEQYENKVNESFQLYALVVLIDSRRSGQMPAWESIRIVREKIST